MGRFLLVVLVVCASVVVEGNNNNGRQPPPPYSTAVAAFNAASEKVLELSPPAGGPHPGPAELDFDDKRRHYGLLVAVVDELTQALSGLCGPSYDEYYGEAVKTGVSRAWEHPADVGNVLTYQQRQVSNELRDVIELVEVQCKDGLGCDEGVDAFVKEHPELYKDQAELLLVVGELARVYLENTYEEEAETFNILRLLTTGQKELRSLVESAVAVRYHQKYHNRNLKKVKC